MELAEIIAVVSLLISFANLYLYYRFSSKSHKPAINHTFKNLPPYKSSKETTEIKVKNVGTAQARINCIYLKFSWDKDLQLFLHDEQIEEEKEFEMFLSPNEEVTFHKSLPQPPLERKEQMNIVTVYDNNMEKEDTIELGIRAKTGIDFLLKK